MKQKFIFNKNTTHRVCNVRNEVFVKNYKRLKMISAKIVDMPRNVLAQKPFSIVNKWRLHNKSAL